MKCKEFSGPIILLALKERHRILESGRPLPRSLTPSELSCRLVEKSFWGFSPSHGTSSVGFSQLLRELEMAAKTREMRNS